MDLLLFKITEISFYFFRRKQISAFFNLEINFRGLKLLSFILINKIINQTFF